MLSQIQVQQIIDFFPEDKRDFKVFCVFKDSRDGWTKKAFQSKAFNRGPTLIIIKTHSSDICGGFTSKGWGGEGGYIEDQDAFVFNMQQKYIPNDPNKAICPIPDGFQFGNGILKLAGEVLNVRDNGTCNVGNDKFYDLEGYNDGLSPLTRQKDHFTCIKIEVFKVIF